MSGERKLGYLKTCADLRFHQLTREAFEKETGLAPIGGYYYESQPGGAAVEGNTITEDVAYADGAGIFGWGAHGDHCAGLPGESDEQIQSRLDENIKKKKEKFPDSIHYRIFATEEKINISEV